jgi:DNA-binding NarL/FixJ family response regulator
MVILIAEKSDIIRTGIRYILHEQDKNQIVKEIENPDKFKRTIEKEKPFLVFGSSDFLNDSYFLGLKISKDKIKYIGICMGAVSQFGANFLSDSIQIHSTKADIFRILQKFSTAQPRHDFGKKDHELTTREIEVVCEIAKGLTNKEIADKLFLSTHTIVTHRKNITRKLGIKTASGLTVYAIINNLIEIN